MTTKPFQYRTDAELEFIIADCNAAISANPENPKVHRYLWERESARRELFKRQEKRLLRRDLHGLADPLAIGHTPGISHPSRYRVRSDYWQASNARWRYIRKQWR